MIFNMIVPVTKQAILQTQWLAGQPLSSSEEQLWHKLPHPSIHCHSFVGQLVSKAVIQHSGESHAFGQRAFNFLRRVPVI